MILSIVVSFLIVLIYYYTFVRFSPQTWTADPSYPLINVNWPFPRDRYKWDGDKIVAKNVCDGIADGTLIPAKGQDVYEFLKKHNLPIAAATTAAPKKHQSDNTSRLYYFECQNQSNAKLFYCPPGTVFDAGECKSLNVCSNKPDGYRYPGTTNTSFYECQGGQDVLLECPPDQVFNMMDACEDPPDPCLLMEDDTIRDYDLDSYKVCHGGVTYTNYCREGEYFNPDLKVCSNQICRGIDDGMVPIQTTKDYFVYNYAYYKCDKGAITAKVKCPREGHPYDNDYWALPESMVFEEGAGCVEPELCKNVHPANDAIPGYLYRGQMSNYKYSNVYDHLYGITCSGGKQKNFVLKAAHRLEEGTGKAIPYPANQKYPVLNTPGDYYEGGNLVTCPPDKPTFDFGKQDCVYTDDTFHSFRDVLPVFKMDQLSDKNWYQPRHKRLADRAKCTGKEIKNAAFDVCVDPECTSVPFLIQLGKGRRILMDDEHMCINTEEEKVKYKTYERAPSLHLDFWRQRLVSGPVSTKCYKRQTRLMSPDFVVNATLYPTCNSDIADDYPFVFCPSNSVHNIYGMPALVYPDPEVGKIVLQPNTDYSEYRMLIDYISCTPGSTLSVDNMYSVLCGRNNRFALRPNPNDPIVILNASHESVIHHKLFTNSYKVYLVEDATKRQKGLLDVYNNVKLNDSDHFEMERYNFDSHLEGFV